jgi:superfamily II DNA/RNA helicase
VNNVNRTVESLHADDSIGSCKAAAYLLPIIISVDKYLDSRNPATGGAARLGCVYAVVIAPTRRLASQIWKDAKDLATVFPRVNVLLCMDNPNNTMGGNLQAIEAGFGQIIVCTLGRLFTLSLEETTQHALGETYRTNVEHALGRFAEQIHRCPTWSIFGSVQILAVDQATDMLSGDYKEDIDRLKESVIPKFAGGYSVLCICADDPDEIENEPDRESAHNSYEEMMSWFNRKGTREICLHLEVIRAVHANLRWDIKLHKIQERGHPGPVHNGHLQLCKIKLPPAAPNGQFPRTLIITERRRDANITAEWIASMNKGAYRHLVCVMHGGQSVVDNEANHNLFLSGQKSICCATSAMVDGGNLKVERLYVMFLPQLSKAKGILNLLDAMGGTGRMGRVAEINFVFEEKDAAVAKVCYGLSPCPLTLPFPTSRLLIRHIMQALRNYFSVNQTSSKQCISDWDNLLKKFEDETPEAAL